MPITFACQHCDRPYTVADSLAGKKAKCKECGNAMDVPAETPADVPVAAEIVSSAKRPASNPRRKPSSSTARKANSTRSKQRRGEKEFGLGELRGTDIFSGSNPSRTPLLDNHAVDPGFAQVTPEEVAYRREAELDAMRNKKPKLEDYLTDDDRLAVQFGVAAREEDEEDVSWKAFLPGIAFAGAMFVLTLIGVVGAFFGAAVPFVIFIILLVCVGICSASSEIWGMMICLKYDSDKFIWYFLFPIYRVYYFFQNLPRMKGPAGMYIASLIGTVFVIIMWAISAALEGSA